jgi:mannose-6-phosphate isomerase-like protein (cupin superfamily)
MNFILTIKAIFMQNRISLHLLSIFLICCYTTSFIMSSYRDDTTFLPEGRRRNNLNDLILRWQNVLNGKKWQDLIKSATFIADGGCGRVHILKTLSERKNEDFVIADMSELTVSHPHYHPAGFTEIYFILAGKGIVVVDDQPKIVKVGDVVVIPPMTSHYTIPNHTDGEYAVGVVTPPFTQKCYKSLPHPNVKFDKNMYNSFENAITD